MSVLLATGALAFLLPFGTVACDGENVSFTGIELATRHVQPDPAATAPDEGLASEVEAAGATYALMVLVFVAGGLVSVAWRARGGGFALAALLSLLVLLLDAIESEAEVGIGVGYWLALTTVSGAGLLRIGNRWRARRRRRGQDPQLVASRGGRLRRLAPSVLLAVSAIAVVVLLEAVTTGETAHAAGTTLVDFSYPAAMESPGRPWDWDPGSARCWLGGHTPEGA